MDMNVMMGRLMRVLRFDASVYREVAADNNAMGQAAVVVVIAAILSAIGKLGGCATGVIIAAIVSVVSFALYSVVATVVAQSLLKGKTSFQEMGRTLGYSFAWYSLGILALVPAIGWLLAWLGWAVSVIAGIIALRESAEFDSMKALITVVVATAITIFLQWIIPGI